VSSSASSLELAQNAFHDLELGDNLELTETFVPRFYPQYISDWWRVNSYIYDHDGAY